MMKGPGKEKKALLDQLLVIDNQPHTWLRKSPSIPKLLQPDDLRSLVFLLAVDIINGKQVSAIKKETKGKYGLASPLRGGGGVGGGGEAVSWN